jgi:hypothetical protein
MNNDELLKRALTRKFGTKVEKERLAYETLYGPLDLSSGNKASDLCIKNSYKGGVLSPIGKSPLTFTRGKARALLDFMFTVGGAVGRILTSRSDIIGR